MTSDADRTLRQAEKFAQLGVLYQFDRPRRRRPQVRPLDERSRVCIVDRALYLTPQPKPRVRRWLDLAVGVLAWSGLVFAAFLSLAASLVLLWWFLWTVTQGMAAVLRMLMGLGR